MNAWKLVYVAIAFALMSFLPITDRMTVDLLSITSLAFFGLAFAVEKK